jgi:hypothetical protein
VSLADQPAWRRFVARVGGFLGDLLPSPPDSVDDYEPGVSGEEMAERRRHRLKIESLEKKGKGGYR